MKRKIITETEEKVAVEAPKDFSELLQEYHSIKGTKGTGSSSLKYFTIAATLAACVLAIVFWNNSPKTATILDTDSTLADALIQENILTDQNFNSYITSVSNSEETLIISPEGVLIEIPKNAFKLADGSIPQDSIELKLTQFDDVISILLSQIPMHYDSAGTRFHFQSDGMFDLAATSGGQEIILRKDLKVHYPQTTGRTNSNNYFLANNEWVFTGNSPLKTADEVCNETVYRFNQEEQHPLESDSKKPELAIFSANRKTLENELEFLRKSTPLEPRKQNFNNYRFYLDVNPSEFPELGSFKDVLFEVKDSRFNFSLYDQTWNDISLKKSSKDGRYLVTLKSGKRIEIFDVYPVLEDEEFELAFAVYSDELKNIREKEKDIATQVKEIKEKEKLFLSSLEDQRNDNHARKSQKRVIGKLTSNFNSESVYRTLSIGNLGICNFDIGLPLPAKGIPVPADFYIAQKNIPVNGVSFIDVKDNIYYSFTRAEFSEFRFLKGKKYILASVLPDGSLAAYNGGFDSQDIKRGQPHRFKLEVAPSKDISELKLFLGIEEPA